MTYVNEIIFNKKQIIDLYQSFQEDGVKENHNDFLFSNLFRNQLSKKVFNKEGWNGQNVSYESKKIFLIENLSENIKITLNQFNYHDLYNINAEILLSYVKKHPEQKILELGSFYAKDQSFELKFSNFYYRAIKDGQINILKNEDSLKDFENITIEIMTETAKYSQYDEQFLYEIQKLALELSMIYIPNESKKLIFCKYASMVGLDIEDPAIREIYEKFRNEDLSAYYKDYPIIKNLYKNNTKIIEKNLLVTSFEINKMEISKENEIGFDIYEKNLNICLKYINEQAKKIIEIDNVQKIQSKNSISIYIIYSQRDDKIDMFLNSYKNFLELVPIQNEKIENKEEYLAEQWNNVSMFINMDNKTPEKLKNMIIRKKI